MLTDEITSVPVVFCGLKIFLAPLKSIDNGVGLLPTKFGMLSVKAGIDKNPNPTQADRIAGAKMKSKKRFV